MVLVFMADVMGCWWFSQNLSVLVFASSEPYPAWQQGILLTAGSAHAVM